MNCPIGRRPVPKRRPGPRSRWAGLAVLAALAAAALTGCGPLPPPQITDVLPPPSQGGVHTNVPIEIVFSVPMNEHSVEVRLSLRSRRGRPAPGCDIKRAAAGRPTGCHFIWSDGGRIMRLVHPGHPLATVTTYRVNLAGGISSAQGAVNSLSHSWGFSTEGGPSLSSTYPSNHGVVGPDQAVAVNFDRAMNQQSVAAAVTLTPKPPGGYTLSANPRVPGRYLLNPVRPLAPGTTYTLTVGTTAKDTDGNRLQAGARVVFTVGRLGSTPTIDFPAGPSPTDYTEVLAASLPEVPGDPPSVRLLTTAPAGKHYTFAWVAPDGQYLATELAGKQEIQVTDLATGKSAAVLGSTASTVALWSPNSQQLAFLAGGALRVYTVATKVSVTLSAQAALGGPLAWRPDSSVLAAVATRTGTPSRIALLSPDLRAVTYIGTSNAGVESDPVWNQQGTALAFAVGTSALPAIWLYQPANVVAPMRLLRRSAGDPLAFLSSGAVLLRTASGSLQALSPTTEQVTPVVGASHGQYPIATAVDDPGRLLAFTRQVAGFVNLFLANQDGTGLAPLTAFDRAAPLDAGPPSFVGS